MSFRDLRAFCAMLETRRALHRVPTPVSLDGELLAVATRSASLGGGALLFASLEGTDGAVLVDAFGSAERVAWAVGGETLEELGSRLGAALEIARAALGGGVGGRLRALGGLAQVGQALPRIVERAPSQQVVRAEAALAQLPLPRDAHGESSIDRAALTWRDPTGERRWAVGNLRPIGERALAGDWLPPGPAVPAAICLGGDPTTIYALGAPIPFDLDPLHLAGFLRGAPVDLVRGRTVPLEVLATAEYVLEGEVGEGRFTLGCLTHRRDPILLVSTPGEPPRDDLWLDRVSAELLLPLMRLAHPEVRALRAVGPDGFRGTVVAAVRTSYPGASRKALHGLASTMPTALARAIVAVDETADLDDPAHCLAVALAGLDGRTDVIALDGPIDPPSPWTRVGHRVLLDATGASIRARRPPPSDGLAGLIERKWPSYGIPL